MGISKIDRRLPCAVAAMALLARVADATEAYDWLSLGSKHWAPTITSKSGIGTAHAVAEARVTRKEIEGWCHQLRRCRHRARRAPDRSRPRR